LTQKAALTALENSNQKAAAVKNIIEQRKILVDAFEQLNLIKKVYPSDANFLLVKVDDPKVIYNYLLENGIIVRDRSNVLLCDGCLRFTVGTPPENHRLIQTLKNYN